MQGVKWMKWEKIIKAKTLEKLPKLGVPRTCNSISLLECNYLKIDFKHKNKRFKGFHHLPIYLYPSKRDSGLDLMVIGAEFSRNEISKNLRY